MKWSGRKLSAVLYSGGDYHERWLKMDGEGVERPPSMRALVVQVEQGVWWVHVVCEDGVADWAIPGHLVVSMSFAG